ncbi:MAG: class I SAM-dependent methyltransferase [Amaricoccus sp.]
MNLPLRLQPFGEAATATAYAPYFATGAYDRRYPRPNPTVLRLIRRLLAPGGHVIDYGCGSGRYLLPLAGRAGIAAGFDICPAALVRLRGAAPAGLVVLGPDADAVAGHVARHGPADLVLCLFGVLSHVEGRDARQRLLRRLHSLLRPESGRLVLSVPNRHRRFRALQRQVAGRDEIRYVRRFSEGAVELPYKLYDPRALAADLAAAGFAVERLAAESLFPETAVARSPVLRTLDRLVAPLLPVAQGYGLVAVARPEPRQ